MKRLLASCIALATFCAPALAEWSGGFDIRTGVGYDSNAYSAPDSTYIDRDGVTTVRPEPKSGVFMPFVLNGEGEYSQDIFTWINKGEFEGNKYFASNLESADECKLSLKTGLKFPFASDSGANRKRHSFYIGPFYRYTKQTYVDSDTGETKTSSGGTPWSDRYTYATYGGEADLKLKFGKADFKVSGEAAQYDYTEVPGLTSLDYFSYKMGGEAEFRVLQETKLSADCTYWVKDYDQYPSHGADGHKSASNPMLNYIYHTVETKISQDLPGYWRASLKYSYRYRVDNFQGYYDYQQHKVAGQIKYADKAGREVQLTAYWADRKYPNAWVFDNPANPHLATNTLDAKLDGRLPVGSGFYLWGDYEYKQKQSEDPSDEYDRHRVMAGVGYTL